MKKLILSKQGEQYLDLTTAEIQQREQDAIQAEADRVVREEKIAQEKANKQSALDKLSALGLTEAEVKAITGI